jgi:ketosteroid isomerase-like protein
VSETAALMRRWDEAMSSQDPAAAAAMSPEDVEYVDHRALGWEPLRGRAALEGWYRSFMQGVEALELHTEVLDVRGDLVLLRQAGSFRAAAQDGGGEGEIVTTTVVTMRDGRFARIEIYEDEAAARAAMGQ